MKTKFLSMVLILIFFISACVGCQNSNNKNDNIIDNSTEQDKFAILNDSYLTMDLINALNEINVDETKITSFEKLEDWVAGPKYSFTYADKIKLIVYCNLNSTVESINYNDEKIYYRGFESYNINNYIYQSSLLDVLIPYTQNIVKSYLSYPSTAKFPLVSSEWAVSRYNNLYYLESWVKASNAFGIEDKINFTTGVYIDQNTNYKTIYFKIDGNIKLDLTEQYQPSEQRKQVTPKYPGKDIIESKGINLKYGQLGQYGEEKIIDGVSYIYYYLPYGTYNVVNNGNSGIIYVESDEMYQNEEGYWENVDTEIYTFKTGSYGNSQTISIPEKYHIELSMYTNVSFIKVSVDDNTDDDETTDDKCEHILDSYCVCIKCKKAFHQIGEDFQCIRCKQGYLHIENNYIYTGSYPQSEVTDELILDSLNKLVATHYPIIEKDWVSYGYLSYQNKELVNLGDYMYYIDIEYNYNKYRGVYLGNYRRPYQQYNKYETKKIYWFKYEPIKWKIIEKTNDKALLVSDVIIDSQEFNTTTLSKEIEGKTIYSNNWEYSSIRNWLNNNFYETAFDPLQQERIKSKILDNKTTGGIYRRNISYPPYEPYYDSTNKYASCQNNTEDKIFLLSRKDVYDIFSSSEDLIKNRTDYSIIQGNENIGGWMLRSPCFYEENYMAFPRVKTSDGGGWAAGGVQGLWGVLPAIEISLI